MNSLSENGTIAKTNRPNDKDSDRNPATQPGEEPVLDDTHKLVWIKEGALIHPVVIEVGINDGINTEIISGLEEGSIVVTSFELTEKSRLSSKQNKDDEQKSPFVQESTQRPGGGGGPGGPPQ